MPRFCWLMCLFLVGGALARLVSCPVSVPVLVSLFQLRRWLGCEQSGVPHGPPLCAVALAPVFVRLACVRPLPVF